MSRAEPGTYDRLRIGAELVPTIAIGDTFCRVGETDAWEVTAGPGNAGLWQLTRGDMWIFTTTEGLLRASLWTRVERL